MEKLHLMIVGAQKAGTSSLLRYLAQHPDLETHAQPEMPFFLHDREYTRGYDWATAKYFHGSCGQRLRIAKNVMLMYTPGALQRLAAHNPKLQIVVLLREPVARAYSAYWWARRRGWEYLQSYEAALAAEETRLNTDRFKWRQCAYQANGIYAPHVERLRTLFGTAQVHCVLTDDLKTDAAGVCKHLFQWIGVKPFLPTVDQRHNTATLPRFEKLNYHFTQFLASQHPLRRLIRHCLPDATAHRFRSAVLQWNERNRISRVPPIHPGTRARQAASFRPFNDTLSDLLGRDLSLWNSEG